MHRRDPAVRAVERKSPANDRRRAVLAAVACVIACSGGARASDLVPDDRRQSSVVPYVWGAAARGDARLQSLPPVAFERGFRDTLSDLEAGGMLVFETRRGAWGLLSEMTYVDTARDVRVPALGIDGTFDTRLATAAALATYRAIDTSTWSLDVLAGARHWDIGLHAQIDAPLILGRRVDMAWTDPLLGLKLGWRPAARHGVTVWAIGGLVDGVPADVLASYGFGLTPSLWLRIGYRQLSVRRQSGGGDVDLSMAGPGAGLEFRF